MADETGLDEPKVDETAVAVERTRTTPFLTYFPETLGNPPYYASAVLNPLVLTSNIASMSQ